MQPAMSLVSALRSRRSIRAFLPKIVDHCTLESILREAGRAPSGSNIQPWRVHVVTGAGKAELSRRVLEAINDPNLDALHKEQFPYYPTVWRSPYIERRRALGWSLYSLLGISREDKDAMKAQHARNFKFFDAPVGLIFTTDQVMERGAWLDCGMYIQNLMLLARTFGLDTCPQAAFNRYHRLIAEYLEFSKDEVMIGAMSLGYADTNKIENTLESERASVESFVTFHS